MANIQIRISDEEKNEAQRVLKSMGLTLSGAVKMFLRKTVHDKKIPFEITADLTEIKVSDTIPATKNDNSTWTNFAKRKIG